MFLYLLGAAAWAEEPRCPDPARAIQSAEQDVVSYFLRDAEIGLTEAIAGLACGPSATPEALAPFWLVRGVLWSFLDDERADSAFAAARLADPAYFPGDYGDGIRARWEAARSPEGSMGELILRGVEEGDWVVLDGVEQTAPWRLAPGFHLVQVGRGETARFARLLDIEADASVTVAVPAAGGMAPTMQMAGVTAFESITAPIRREGGHYVDARDQPLSWRLQVHPLAASDASGKSAVQLYRTNLPAGIGLGVLGAGAAYSTYVFAWDATVGGNMSPAGAWTLTSLSAVTAGSSLWLSQRLLRRRAQLRRDIESAANRTLGGSAR